MQISAIKQHIHKYGQDDKDIANEWMKVKEHTGGGGRDDP